MRSLTKYTHQEYTKKKRKLQMETENAHEWKNSKLKNNLNFRQNNLQIKAMPIKITKCRFVEYGKSYPKTYMENQRQQGI